jgi:hypothetical protein
MGIIIPFYVLILPLHKNKNAPQGCEFFAPHVGECSNIHQRKIKKPALRGGPFVSAKRAMRFIIKRLLLFPLFDQKLRGVV